MSQFVSHKIPMLISQQQAREQLQAPAPRRAAPLARCRPGLRLSAALRDAKDRRSSQRQGDGLLFSQGGKQDPAGSGARVCLLAPRSAHFLLLAGRASRGMELNARLLRLQSPLLAAEGSWACPAPAPFAGGLLLATRQAGDQLGADFRQAVVFLLQHGPRGSLGMVLNHPTCERLGQDCRGEVALVRALDGPPNSRLYWGGPEGERVLTLLHGGERSLLPPSCQVAPGVWAVFDQDAVADAAAGDLALGLTPLRFLEGACTWGPGELERQLQQGAWTCAGASRSLVLKHSSQLPSPLWQEVSELAAAGCCEPHGCELAPV
ncbi:hypothetical protein ABPG75_006813 [Micractinium tetrahymenae]